jgi:hypothetical protein
MITTRLTKRQKTTAKSSAFGWQYELDVAAPVVTTKAEIATIAAAHNQTVGIELVGGTMMLIDVMQRKQVARMEGAVDEWARAHYPSEELLNDSGLVEELKSEVTGHLDNMRAGMSLKTSLKKSLAARSTSADVGGTVKRQSGCPCPFFIFSCGLTGCPDSACLLLACL